MNKIIDRNYCMSSFLMYRTIIDKNRCFAEGIDEFYVEPPQNRIPIHNSAQLYNALEKQVKEATQEGKAALALSGGIDSAILARFMPRGSTAYTFKCVVPGMDVTDESPMAAKYAKECGLKHKIIEIYWEDFEKYAPILMKHKGAPIHSIECQIYKAALQAKSDGFDTMIYGESSDLLYGGLSGLLSKDWTLGEFVVRYSYVLPFMVLRHPVMEYNPFYAVEADGMVDVHKFNNTTFLKEALNSYVNANSTAKMNVVMPYSNTFFAEPLDYLRIRAGENKYLVREVFKELYPNFDIPVKTPMPRPMNEWLKEYVGGGKEFIPNCAINMTGDQKWLVYILEKFLEMIDSRS